MLLRRNGIQHRIESPGTPVDLIHPREECRHRPPCRRLMAADADFLRAKRSRLNHMAVIGTTVFLRQRHAWLFSNQSLRNTAAWSGI